MMTRPIEEPVMLLGDLCGLMASGQVRDDALLQLDYKEDARALTPQAIENFARAVAPVARNVILSSGDAEAVAMLARGLAALPGGIKLRTGFDPSDETRFRAALAAGTLDQFVADALRAAPEAELIYLHWQMVTTAADAGFDLVAAFHAHGKRIDAWTIREITPESVAQVRRLLDSRWTRSPPTTLRASWPHWRRPRERRRHSRGYHRSCPRGRRRDHALFRAVPQSRDRHQGTGGLRLRGRPRDGDAHPRASLRPLSGWSFTGEEFDPVDHEGSDYRWLVDPIDGTTNFLNGMHYTISIALRRGRETVLGVLYNPPADEMFTAIRGRGAYLNGERLAVSGQSDVALMCVGTGLPTPNLSLYPGSYARLDAIRAPIGAVRIVGSAANSCAYVAMGRLTGYFEETGFTDTAASILMAQEAGAMVTDWWGRGPDYYERTGASSSPIPPPMPTFSTTSATCRPRTRDSRDHAPRHGRKALFA